MAYMPEDASQLILRVFLVTQLQRAVTMGSIYNTTQLLDRLLNNYDRRLRPGFGGPPTMVDVNLNIRSMGPITEKDMTYKMDCYFRQSWVDRRLAFVGVQRTLTVSINLLERMWKPDTHFHNGRASYLHTVTTPNKLLRINRDGRILYSMRLTVQASCPMHLQKFPMDTQVCPLSFGSHGYTIKEVVYKWTYGDHNSIRMSSDMRLSQFDLIGYPAHSANMTVIKDAYSQLRVKFVLRRHTGYFLINVYVPCALLTVLSWVGFWINREATADRISLGVMVVLTMVFLGIDSRTDLPKVSYATALDYYLQTCFGFVLATIIQFAAVHFFTKRGSGEVPAMKWEETLSEEGQPLVSSHVVRAKHLTGGDSCNGHHEHQLALKPDCSSSSGHQVAGDRWAACRKLLLVAQAFLYCLGGSAAHRRHPPSLAGDGDDRNSVSTVDRAARIAFPVLFIIFNVFYGVVYGTQTLSG